MIRSLGISLAVLPYLAASVVAVSTNFISGTALYCSVFIPAAAQIGYPPIHLLRRHRHRLGRHAGHLLARPPAAAGEELTSRYFVVERETLYQSPVALTPYAARSGSTTERSARSSTTPMRPRIHPDDIDTGAVILTGEALRRENAKAIADVLPSSGGEFVCAAAGHHMEAMLAAYGSGAARVSHDAARSASSTSTSAAAPPSSRSSRTAAWSRPRRCIIGGRLQVVDSDGRIVRLDPAGRRHAARPASTGTRATSRRPPSSIGSAS